MRRLALPILAILVTLAAPAAAEPDPEAGNVAFGALLSALERGSEADVVAALGAKVKLDGAKFGDAACDKAFGGTVTVRGAKRTKLARCLIAVWKAKKTASEPVVRGAGTGWKASLAIGSAAFVLELVPGKKGAPQVAAITVDGGAPKKLRPIVKKKVVDIVQPTKAEIVEEEGWVEGEEGGVEGGDVDGVYGGVIGGVAEGWREGEGPAAPPPPPPPPAPPQNVAPSMLEAQRIAGDKNIQPDDATKIEILRSGKERLVASWKLCISATGDVASANLLKSSGFPAYDEKMRAGIKTWRYRPYQVNGKPAPVCTAVTFIYSQAQPDPPQPSP
jgi:protein TonB